MIHSNEHQQEPHDQQRENNDEQVNQEDVVAKGSVVFILLVGQTDVGQEEQEDVLNKLNHLVNAVLLVDANALTLVHEQLLLSLRQRLLQVFWFLSFFLALAFVFKHIVGLEVIFWSILLGHLPSHVVTSE